MRYGAVPLVSRVGGLTDTVIGASPMALSSGVATGLQFSPVQGPMLERSIRHAVRLYRDAPTWRRIQRNGMITDVSWSRPAQRYATLFTELTRKAAG